MARAHLVKAVIRKTSGTPADGVCQVYEAGGTTPLAQTMYTTDAGGTVQANPINFVNGVVEFYIPNAQRVRLDITPTGGSVQTFDNVDVPAPAGAAVTFGASGDISASAVADTVAAGATGKVADAGHRHAREGFGTVTAQTTFGASSSNGSATTEARSDHAHGTPATPSAAAVGAPTTAQYDELRLQRIMSDGACPSLRISSPTILTGSSQAVLTVAAGRKYVIKSIIISSAYTSPITVDITAAGVYVARGLNMTYRTRTIDGSIVLAAGETLSALASVASQSNISVVYVDLASSESPTRPGTVNGTLTAATWTTIFTAGTNLVLTSVTFTTATNTRPALRVGTGNLIIDTVPLNAGDTWVLDSPIYVPNGSVVQLYDTAGNALCAIFSGYPAAS